MQALVKSGQRQHFELSEVSQIFEPPSHPLRVILLADDQHLANVVQDHIRSIVQHSSHQVTVVNSRNVTAPDNVRPQDYDAVLIHYSIYVIADTYLSEAWCAFISRFHGPVAVIHEDEYQNINAFKRKFDALGVQAVFSCLDSVTTLQKVYASSTALQETLFFSCLPGYVPQSLMDLRPPATFGRRLHLVYRGRILAPELGRFAQEKQRIGEQMQLVADAHGLTCDISSTEEDRIYGPQWPEFLMSGKAMLGVEGGASIFDFDGEIRAAVDRYQTESASSDFEEVWNAVLARHEGNIQFRTITPKFFEAIAAGTVLVLYPGRYSNLLVPGRHYIVLERDGANTAEVVAKLKDDQYLQDMADLTREEILQRADVSSRFYVEQMDRVLSRLVQHPTRYRLGQKLNATAKFVLAEKSEMGQHEAAAQRALSDAREAFSRAKQDAASTQGRLIGLALEVQAIQGELSASRNATVLLQQALNTARQELLATQELVMGMQQKWHSTAVDLASLRTSQEQFEQRSVRLAATVEQQDAAVMQLDARVRRLESALESSSTLARTLLKTLRNKLIKNDRSSK